MLDTGLKKTKKKSKKLSAVQQDRQGFGFLLSKGIHLKIALQFPITPYPLNIATPTGELRQAPKHLFRNELFESAKASQDAPPLKARWIVDNMALVRAMKPKKTIAEWMKGFLKFARPSDKYDPLTMELVNDRYEKESAKWGAREGRGEESRRVHIGGFETNMLQGNEWAEFFHNIENKEDLIAVMAKYIMFHESEETTLPIIFTEKEETWMASEDGLTNIGRCNHEEADSRMIYHALRSNTNVVVVSKDTDVLILMIYAYALYSIEEEWVMKIGPSKYVNIAKIVKHISHQVSIMLPYVHALTGCDTTSYLYGVGKIRVFNKILKKPSVLSDLETLGQGSGLPVEYSKIERFVKTVCFAGKENETLVETRERLYNKQKVKSSQSLPPDPDSLKQAILRANHQMYYWSRLNIPIVRTIPLSDNGWMLNEDGGVVPVWFTGM